MLGQVDRTRPYRQSRRKSDSRRQIGFPEEGTEQNGRKQIFGC
jgi:hypothetical protein